MANWMDSALDWTTAPAKSLLGNVGRTLGLDNNEAIDSAQDVMQGVLDKANAVSAQNGALYRDYLDSMRGTFGDGAGKYQAAVDRLASAIGEAPDTFDYNGNVNEFYDPYANQRRQQAMDAINNGASAGGNRFSSSYNDAVAAKQQALASEEWKEAFERMMRDRSQQMSEWQAGQSSKQNFIGNLGTMAGLYGNDRSQLADALGNYYSNVANQNNANLEVYSDVAQTNANLDSQRKSGIGGALGAIGDVVGAIF